MPQRLTINTFNKGQNTDVDKAQLEPVFATDIQNIELVGDGKFLAATNIRGTTNVVDIINDSSAEVLGVFSNKYKIGNSADIKCLTIFTHANNTFKIWAYDTENDDLYELFEESTENDYMTSSRVIDAKSYAENNIDYLYFNDKYNEPRYLRCEIPSPYSANFLNEFDLSLLRRGANGIIELSSIASGGTLLSGTYQFAYRMADPTRKKFTKWSSLTNPIHVYGEENSGEKVSSGVGLPTEFKITINITPSDEEQSNFDYFQIAVVENIYPDGSGSIEENGIKTFIASLLPITANSELTGYEYKTNNRIGTVPIEDIVVDLAAVQNAKTLNVKNNKLFLGNISYQNLEFDNGEPFITTGAILTDAPDDHDPYSDHEYSSTKRGYFRDEVYRFGIVYFDKYGNKSSVKVLDLSGVTDNTITGGLTDIRFPARSDSDYTLFDNSSRIRAMYLQLNGIDNHPTWAVGFEIVRVKRIKRILFQTPLIPMMEIEGVGALESYPSSATTASGVTTSFSNAQPQTLDKVIVPKNLFWPDLRKITRRTTSTSFAKAGEAELSFKGNHEFSMIFPQSNMYGDTPFVFSGAESMEEVDYVSTALSKDDYNTSVLAGDDINTKIAGTFFGLSDDRYYFNAGHLKSPLTASHKIKDYEYFDNLASGGLVSGEKVFQYDKLQTQNVTFWPYAPTTQRCAVVKTESIDDLMKTGASFSAGNHNAFSGSGSVRVFGSSGPFFEVSGALSNQFITEYANYSDSTTRGSHAFRIVNVVLPYGDDRYGDVETQHEFVSTGSKYTFSTAELVDVQAGNSLPINMTVYGGDCFISSHIFKISDSSYSVTNHSKNYGAGDSEANLLAKWDNVIFLYDTPSTFIPSTGLMIPVALNKVGTYIQIILESEYNGEVRDNELLEVGNAIPAGGIPVYEADSESKIRAPLTYSYNLNLSKQNDQKVYFVEPEFSLNQSDFGARILISDQKVYNTDEQGFDIFRVLNLFDLEESRGNITKLAIGYDRLYAIQERGIVDLPVGVAQIEQTDAGTLSVGTGSDIGRPIVIDTERGGQHLRGIVETGGIIYIPDNKNKALYALAGQEIKVISDIFNASKFRTLFTSSIDESDLVGIYDPIRKEYWVGGNDFCQRFNELLQEWHGNYEFPSGGLKGGIFTNQNLYLIGKVSNQVSAFTAYTGDYNQLFGTTVTPRITFVVNPDTAISKSFDNQMYQATDRLATVDFIVERESSIGNQVVSGTILDVISREGNFRIKLPRDNNGERLRGLRLSTTVKWKTGVNDVSTLSGVFTKYRFSARTPF